MSTDGAGVAGRVRSCDQRHQPRKSPGLISGLWSISLYIHMHMYVLNRIICIFMYVNIFYIYRNV